MGFFSLSTMMLLNGFMLPAEKVGWWFRWFTYINPLQWAFAGLVINEFDGLEFDFPGGGQISGETFRKDMLKIDYDNEFKWYILLILILLTLAGVAFGCWVCENIRHDEVKHKVPVPARAPKLPVVRVCARTFPSSHIAASMPAVAVAVIVLTAHLHRDPAPAAPLSGPVPRADRPVDPARPQAVDTRRQQACSGWS